MIWRTHLGEVYGYDTLHRLTQMDRGVPAETLDAITQAAPAPFVQTWDWDDLDMLGNWKSTITTINEAASTDARTVNEANEYADRQIDTNSVQSLTHDDNGNLASNGAQEYDYDAENRLIRVTESGTVMQEYAYDAIGRRVQTVDLPETTHTTTTHVYAAGPACIAEYDSTQEEGGERLRWFVHGPEFPDPLAMVDETDLGSKPGGEEEFFYYLKDLLGSVVALASSNGAVVERYVYDPYGKTAVERTYFYHDYDFNGRIDDADADHLEACLDTPMEPLCVWMHDRNNDNRVTMLDQSLFVGFYESGESKPAPAEWARPYVAFFDVNPDALEPDGQVDLLDFLAFQICLDANTDAYCLEIFDADLDGDVDLDDYGAFAADFGTNGPQRVRRSPSSRWGNPYYFTGRRLDFLAYDDVELQGPEKGSSLIVVPCLPPDRW